MLRPEFHLVDGENLVFRYQAMLAAGSVALPGVAHRQNTYVWHPDLVSNQIGEIRRITYYTSMRGDEASLLSVADELRAFQYKCSNGTVTKNSHLFAQVYKKPSQGQKSRSVDINITIDALRHATNGSAGHVSLYSGDGDFLPLVEALMDLGIEVHVKALSSGLNPRMRVAADEFYLLDSKFFAAA